GFGTTPSDLLNSLLTMLGGERLRSLNIMPDRILNAVIALSVGTYLLRSVRRWLDAELLPKLCMEAGLRASLVTLFSNIGYVLIVLLTLSLLGVKWGTWPGSSAHCPSALALACRRSSRTSCRGSSC